MRKKIVLRKQIFHLRFTVSTCIHAVQISQNYSRHIDMLYYHYCIVIPFPFCGQLSKNKSANFHIKKKLFFSLSRRRQHMKITAHRHQEIFHCFSNFFWKTFLFLNGDGNVQLFKALFCKKELKMFLQYFSPKNKNKKKLRRT